MVSFSWSIKCSNFDDYLPAVVLILSIQVLGIRMRIFASRQCADYAGAGEARVARVTFAV